MKTVKILPGEHYVTQDPGEMLVTILGSCVAACIRDPVAAVGGMNHFLLPSETGSVGMPGNAMRYGEYAMRRLINDILACGGRHDRLEVKLFGGANVLRSTMRIGDDNALFVRQFLALERLKVTAADLGGSEARRIHYFPLTGQVFRLVLREPDDAVFHGERAWRSKIRSLDISGGVEFINPEDSA